MTLLFTDIEGSTNLWEKFPERMAIALRMHDTIVRDAIERANGFVFRTVGDAFCASFSAPVDAAIAALNAQRALAAADWPESTRIKVRMALHTGAVDVVDGEYVGRPLNRVARLLATGAGEQTLLCEATANAARENLPDGVFLRDLGIHRLRDLTQPEHVFELRFEGLRDDFAPIKSLSTHPNNLPHQVTTFIGRRRETKEVSALLGEHRLVTLLGPGGCGKTRLAIQVAAETLVDYPDGAWLVALDAITDQALVAQTCARALGVAEESDRDLVDTIAEHVASRKLCVVLDNCEHVLDACARLTDVVMRRCPGVNVLATSREPLNVAGERNYIVGPLSLPSAAKDESISASESVELFVDRARLVNDAFRIDASNEATVASLCRKLDGLPLAIELAGARTRGLDVQEIERRLDERFEFLKGGSRTALPRHQTLRALISWSHDLLNERERLLFHALAIFAGGWTLAAAEAVCSSDALPEGEIVDVLTSLVAKNLVVFDDDHARYRFLQSIREYAEDKLTESGDVASLRARHREYFADVADDIAPRLLGAEQAKWLVRLEWDHDNYRAALAASLAVADSTTGLRICGALCRFWATRGYLREGRRWCEQVLVKPGAQPRMAQRATALQGLGLLAYYQADFSAARAAFEESLATRRALGDELGTGTSLNNLGNVAIEQGDYATAKDMHEQSLALARKLGDRSSIANSLLNLGVVCDKLGDYRASRPLYEECLAIRRELSDRRGIAVALNNLATAAFEQGDRERARTLHEESLAIRRELGDRRGIAISLGNRANLAFEEGEHDIARTLAAESLTIGAEIGDQRQIAHALELLAAVHAVAGDVLRAARAWGAAERLRDTAGVPVLALDVAQYEGMVSEARAKAASVDAFDEAWAAGRAPSFDLTTLIERNGNSRTHAS